MCGWLRSRQLLRLGSVPQYRTDFWCSGKLTAGTHNGFGFDASDEGRRFALWSDSWDHRRRDRERSEFARVARMAPRC